MADHSLSDKDKNAAAELHVTDLRTEHVALLLGTEEKRPRLSWRIEAEGRNIVQRRYRIRAANSSIALAASESLLWDSGFVDDNATFDIMYGGPPLLSMQRVWWDVEVFDNQGRSARAAPAWFETGLLSPEDWRGEWLEAEDELAAADRRAGVQWIWSENALDPKLHGFRIDFDAPASLVRTEIFVAGKDHLKGVWVNGEAAGLARKVYWGTMLPVEAELRPGRNCVCVAVAADTTGFFPVDGGAMAALIRLHRRDGAIERIVSNPGWRVQSSPDPNWTKPDFDASKWIAASPSGSRAQGDPRPQEPGMHMRTDFIAKANVVSARLYATALGAYEARLNGARVSDAVLAPEVSVAKDHILYQTYDVSELINEGANALAFTVADGFYAGAFGWRMERYGFGPAPRRLLAQLRLDYADGSSEWVTTGRGWRMSQSPVIAADIYGGETFDARLKQDGWDAPGFNDAEWRSAPIGKPPPARLVAQTSPPIRPMHERLAANITQPASGRFVFDFGQNFSGWARLRARGPAGAEIILRYGEQLAADGTVDQANLRFADATDKYTLRGDASGEIFEPNFTYHGFRYVEVENYPGTPSAEDLPGIVAYSACLETGEMEFASPLLEKIWSNGFWSQRSNFFAVPTDCPQRDERMGWLGDIQVFLDAAAFNMEVDPFIRRFLLEARAAQREDGAYPIVAPQPLSFPDVLTAGWSEAGIILPYQLWRRYGDTAVIEENWTAMERWMNFVARNNPDFIWRHDRGLDLGDWLSVDAIAPSDETTPRILCATAYWAYCAQLMSEMATATGRASAADRYGQLRAQIGEAFASELISSEGVAGNGSQTSQVLALYMNLVPDVLKQAVANVLKTDIERRGMKLSAGFLGTPYLLDVLADAGEMGAVSGLLLQTGYPSWGYMPMQGATTMWERWNSDGGDLTMNSFNHYAFGAVIGFFYRRLAGIAPAAPGFRRIAVRPLWLPEVGRIAARYRSSVGEISTIVDGDETALSSLSLTVPANTVAEIELPAGYDWREGGQTILRHRDITLKSSSHEAICFEVGSGKYVFTR